MKGLLPKPLPPREARDGVFTYRITPLHPHCVRPNPLGCDGCLRDTAGEIVEYVQFDLICLRDHWTIAAFMRWRGLDLTHARAAELRALAIGLCEVPTASPQPAPATSGGLR